VPTRSRRKDDADLGEDLEGVDIRDGGAGSEWADQNAAQDVTEDQRLTGDPGECAAEHGGDEHVRQVPDEQGVGQHGLANIP
jgi:hypothetical protein